MNRFFPWGLLTCLALAFLLVFVGYPVLGVLGRSFVSESGGFSFDGFATFLTRGRYLEALMNTVVLGVVVTCTCTIVGVFLAFVVARYELPFSNVIMLLPLSVLIIPELISAQSWVMVFGNNGLVTNLFDAFGIKFPRFYGWFGLIYVMTLTFYVHVFLAALAALRGWTTASKKLDRALAQPLFRPTCAWFFRPSCGGALLGADRIHACGRELCDIYRAGAARDASVGDDLPKLHQRTGWQPDDAIDTGNSLNSAGCCGAVSSETLPRQTQLPDGGGAHATPQKTAWLEIFPCFGAGRADYPALAAAGTGGAAGILHRVAWSGPVLGEFTLEHYQRIWAFNMSVIGNSLKFASLATILGVTFATLVSYLLIKKRNALSPAVDYLLLLPLTISGTVLGIALAQGFNSGPVVLTGTAMLMVLAMMVRRLPFGVRNASSNLHNISNSLEEASVSLGVPPLRTVRNVVLPLMAPGIAAAAILTWVTTVAELSASVVIYQAGQETLPIQIFRLISSDLMARASAFGVINMIIILVPVFIGIKVMKVRLFST
ncbi:ABC transporter permease [Sulfitobacter porphyrae]|uniref:ABC transporter permease n=1 Tax=Sulfitobacter porphyrae TaxID=1246864 RepID=A0ABW2B8Z1_9RHOB